MLSSGLHLKEVGLSSVTPVAVITVMTGIIQGEYGDLIK